jgi:hypothetical protein
VEVSDKNQDVIGAISQLPFEQFAHCVEAHLLDCRS